MPPTLEGEKKEEGRRRKKMRLVRIEVGKKTKQTEGSELQRARDRLMHDAPTHQVINAVRGAFADSALRRHRGAKGTKLLGDRAQEEWFAAAVRWATPA